MARATAPTLPSFFGSTKTTRTPGTSGRYIQREIFLGMRIVWGWAATEVADSFHPRHALERWYRYHLFSDVPISAMRDAGRPFVGIHRMESFTSDPAPGPMTIDRVDVAREGGTLLVDVR